MTESNNKDKDKAVFIKQEIRGETIYLSISKEHNEENAEDFKDVFRIDFKDVFRIVCLNEEGKTPQNIDTNDIRFILAASCYNLAKQLFKMQEFLEALNLIEEDEPDSKNIIEK